MWPSSLDHVISINSVKNKLSIYGFNLIGSLGFVNRFIKVERGSI